MPIPSEKGDKTPKKGKKNKEPNGWKLWRNIVTAFLVFLLLGSLYSVITDYSSKSTTIPLSEVANDIKAGKVSEIKVEGEELKVLYTEGAVTKDSKKEEGTALTQSLVNYGVPQDKLSSVKIAVTDPQGAAFWIAALVPWFLPSLLIGFLIWLFLLKIPKTPRIFSKIY